MKKGRRNEGRVLTNEKFQFSKKKREQKRFTLVPGPSREKLFKGPGKGGEPGW